MGLWGDGGSNQFPTATRLIHRLWTTNGGGVEVIHNIPTGVPPIGDNSFVKVTFVTRPLPVDNPVHKPPRADVTIVTDALTRP